MLNKDSCEKLIKEVEENTTIYQRFMFLLARLVGRWDPPSIEFLKEHTGFRPDYAHKDGLDGRYRTTKTMKTMVSAWRSADKLLEKPMSENELDKIDDACDEALRDLDKQRQRDQGDSDHSDAEKESVHSARLNYDYWNSVNHTVSFDPSNSRLPMIAGCLLNTHTGRKVVTPVLVDSGATISVVSLEVLKQLNVSTSQLKTDNNITISTVVSSCRSHGTIDLPLYMTDISGKVCMIFVRWVVISGPQMKKSILGCDALQALQYKLEYTKDQQHLLTIWAVSSAKNAVRRKFNLKNILDSALYSNLKEVSRGKSVTTFVADEPPVFEGNNISLTCDEDRVHVDCSSNGNISHRYKVDSDEDGVPTRIYSEVSLGIHSVDLDYNSRAIQVKMSSTEKERDDLLFKIEEDVACVEEEMNFIKIQEQEEADLARNDHMDRLNTGLDIDEIITSCYDSEEEDLNHIDNDLWADLPELDSDAFESDDAMEWSDDDDADSDGDYAHKRSATMLRRHGRVRRLDRVDQAKLRIMECSHVHTDRTLDDSHDDQVLERAQEYQDNTPSLVKEDAPPGPKLPKTEHLEEISPRVRRNFQQLFEDNVEAFSQSNFDIGRVTVLPAVVRGRPGVRPVAEGSRRYAMNELQIIREHCEAMARAGVVERIDYKQVDPNLVHHLHLVIRN